MRAVDDLQRIRRRGFADDTWPAHSVAMWRELATAAAERYRHGPGGGG